MEISGPSDNPLVILNPAANRSKIAHYRALLQQQLSREPFEYIETSRPGEAQELARRAADQERSIVIVGGDGSVHEVINGILAAGKQVPLGIVGAGSGNDYAWNTLQLPRDPAQALELAFRGRPIQVDAGIVNGHYFVNSFSVGLMLILQ
ncbi:diacylglycerol/lipid kinase family protein [Ktedonosporobacter rubrisoli]|uniref:diacylglycerol/lipid kinase family protein n=1 Tax=Ktedonosporobacter rubrisoli TaxID=2509675 RepID=UPI001F5CDDC1|nr:acylglycerol kinase family protein [Ktedonosporobacter rubrisoli]